MPMIAETLDNANQFRKQFNVAQNETWNELADNVLVLRENGVTLEFTTMNGSAVVKQADVIMVTFPLRYTTNYTAEDSLNDLDYVSNPNNTTQNIHAAEHTHKTNSMECSMPTRNRPTAQQ